jgi:hypothetical protein
LWYILNLHLGVFVCVSERKVGLVGIRAQDGSLWYLGGVGDGFGGVDVSQLLICDCNGGEDYLEAPHLGLRSARISNSSVSMVESQ